MGTTLSLPAANPILLSKQSDPLISWETQERKKEIFTGAGRVSIKLHGADAVHDGLDHFVRRAEVAKHRRITWNNNNNLSARAE